MAYFFSLSATFFVLPCHWPHHSFRIHFPITPNVLPINATFWSFHKWPPPSPPDRSYPSWFFSIPRGIPKSDTMDEMQLRCQQSSSRSSREWWSLKSDGFSADTPLSSPFIYSIGSLNSDRRGLIHSQKSPVFIHILLFDEWNDTFCIFEKEWKREAKRNRIVSRCVSF
jgi:hypothetical protein